MIPITQNLLQTLENQNTQNFSTDLTLSCEIHTELNANKCNEEEEEEEAMMPDDDGTQNLLQTLENQNTQTLSCEFRTKQEQKVVSTALSLFDKSWVSSNNKRKSTQKDEYATATASISHNSMVASNAQEEEGTSSMTTLSAVSPWKITKTLTKSDTGGSSRLLLPQSLVHTHIMAFFSADSVKKIESNGLSVTVFDRDSKSDYELVFKMWHSSKSYVFNGKWHGDFVARRELKVGDIIGLYWDPCQSKFNFCFLQTAH